MILVDREIKKAVETGELTIEPFIEENVGPTSYDVTLSPHFVYYPHQIFDTRQEIEYGSLTIKEDECIILSPPHYTVLYDDSQDLVVFRTKNQMDMAICAEDINLAVIDDTYAIFTSLLASTNEYIALPSHISAEYTGRSSLGRIFLQTHQTAGWIDAGFEGTITLELMALDCPVILYPYMKIGQLIFYKHNKCEIPYGKRQSSKYHRQMGATPTRLHLEM